MKYIQYLSGRFCKYQNPTVKKKKKGKTFLEHVNGSFGVACPIALQPHRFDCIFSAANAGGACNG